MKTVSLALIAVVIIVAGCEYTTPAPEVEIVRVNPLTGAVTQSMVDSFLTIEEIDFMVYNFVEAVITEFQIEYLDSDADSTIAPALPPVQMHFVLAVDTAATTLVGVPIPVTQELINYIYSADDFANARLTFRGEDNYGHEKTFDVDMNWGIWKFD
ncbi:MAG: hypothetical protein ACE5JA_01395 [bacterium]